MRAMGVIEFEIERLVSAPVHDVFARLADIEGHNDWMPGKGSILARTRQTSPGAPALGTTYLDKTSFGSTPGEIVEFEPPHVLVYHWWNRSGGGRLHVEGWPGYGLTARGDDETVVRHHSKLITYGVYQLATPVLHWVARRERTATMEALTASFRDGRPGTRA
jgi:uncharacterized protein YndB with AHSA1/START domain